MERINQTLTLSGRKGIFPVQFGVNEGVYARGDGASFGDSQVNKPELAEVDAKFIYALFEISGPTMSATRDSPGSFEEALALSLENTITGLQLDLSRQVIGDGTGTIALYQDEGSGDGNNDFDVDSPFGLSRYKSTRTVKNILRNDMPVDVLDAGSPGTAHGSNMVITGVTHSEGSHTRLDVDSAPTAVDNAGSPADDGDLVTRNGNYNNEIEGFLAAIDDTGSYLNISRSGNVGWQGNLVDAADGGANPVPLTPDHLRDTVDLIMEDTGEQPDFMVGNFKQRRNVYNLFAPQIRRAPMVLPAGLREDTLSFDDMPFVVERFFPPEHIGFVNTDFWAHAIDNDVEWIQGLNGTVLHFHRTADLFTAVLKTYRNLVCRYPATNGIIYGLEE